MEKEIVQNLKWAREIADKLSVLPKGSEDLSIYRVPSKLRKVKEDAYNPRVVSIGPLHRDSPNLIVAMKEHKWRYMLFLLQQTNDFKDTIYDLWKSYILNAKVCASYAEDLPKIKVDDLAEIMLVDGCFMLALFLRYDQYCSDIPLENQSNDPIFNTAWMIPALKHDLALLENQIPFIILKTLYDIIKLHIPQTGKYTPPNSVTSLALNFFQPMNQKAIKEDTNTADCKHLLHLLHNFFLPRSGHIVELGPAKASNQHARKVKLNCEKDQYLGTLDPANNGKLGFNFCASELVEAGIEFQKQSSDHLLDIEFSRGIIRIPPMSIDGTTDSLLRNMIALEQYSLASKHHITSYAIVMKSLVRSPRDVNLLRKKGIFNQNWIEDEEYLTMFKTILDEIVVKDFCFGDLCQTVNAYGSKFRFLPFFKSLNRTYFSTAWSLTSFIAACCLFILTFLQTYYTIHPR